MKLVRKLNYLRNRRLRVFAGPNGSGKTTILTKISNQFDVGYYINADDIEKQLRDNGFIDLRKFGIERYPAKKLQKDIGSHSLYRKAVKEGYAIDIRVEAHKIYNPNQITHSYEAALIADLLRHQLLKIGKKFTFETVMSHSSKIDFLKKTQLNGYKNYLYFVSTESPLINKERVRQRVEMGGHPVNEAKIESRYYNSHKLLKAALPYTYRSFIFDNSDKASLLILEIFEGEQIIYKHNEIPNWIDKYVLS